MSSMLRPKHPAESYCHVHPAHGVGSFAVAVELGLVNVMSLWSSHARSGQFVFVSALLQELTLFFYFATFFDLLLFIFVFLA